MDPGFVLNAKEIIGVVVVGGAGLVGLIKTGHLNLKVGKSNNNAKVPPASNGAKDVDKRVDRLTEVVQYTSTCVATHKAVDQRLGRIESGIDTLIARK